jgi:hypothetical protein
MAVWLTYGTDSRLDQFAWGLSVIQLTRRLWGLLVVGCLLPCVAIFGLVLGDRLRAWWLIVLAPVTLVLAHGLTRVVAIDTNVVTYDVEQLATPNRPLDPAEQVVGVILNDQSYAFPRRNLLSAPAVILADRTHRVLVVWNEGAWRATALRAGIEVKAADLDVVSQPGGSVLLYNKRYSEFIVGATGREPDGSVPVAMADATAELTTWASWKERHPKTKTPSIAPTPAPPPPPIDEPGHILRLPDRPIAFADTELGELDALNFNVDQQPVLIFRDATGQVRAFLRKVGDDLFPVFSLRNDPITRRLTLYDADSGSTWSLDGVAIDGQSRGQKLTSVPVNSGVNLKLIRRWDRTISVVKLRG